MGTWGQLLQELNVLANVNPAQYQRPGAASPHDLLRRKYLKKLHEHTGRAVIVYATPWLENRPSEAGGSLSVDLGDVQGFMEACSNADERELDLIVTSPGGSPDAAESITSYLRTQFDHIRVVVPVAAMSAATMIALAADEIVMGTHSQLGPIDPQFTVFTPEGPRASPGQAILDQFEEAKLQCQDPANIGAWLPMLRALLPGLLADCRHQRERAEEFAATSLEKYMFAGQSDAKQKAQAAAAWFSDFSSFKSHGRRVSKEDARAQGLSVIDLESDKVLQDLVLSVHHAVRLTFSQGPTSKLIENHHGRAYIEITQQQLIQLVGPQPQQAPTVLPAQPASSPSSPPPGAKPQNGKSRAERRRKNK